MHIETSGGIRVTVMPFYMGCRVRGRGRWVGSTHTKMVGNMACGVSDTACTDCWAVFLFVQEVQQAKVHWVSGKIRDSCVCAQAHTHTHTHTHTHSCPLFLQWRYNIRLENFTSDRVQLRERHWRIYGSTGTLETVKGRGVIGQVGRVQTWQRVSCRWLPREILCVGVLMVIWVRHCSSSVVLAPVLVY